MTADLDFTRRPNFLASLRLHRLFAPRFGPVAAIITIVVYHGFIDIVLFVLIPSFVISIVGIVFKELVIEHTVHQAWPDKVAIAAIEHRNCSIKFLPARVRPLMFFLSSSYRAVFF